MRHHLQNMHTLPSPSRIDDNTKKKKKKKRGFAIFIILHQLLKNMFSYIFTGRRNQEREREIIARLCLYT